MEEKRLSPVREKLAGFCDRSCPICLEARKHPGSYDHWFVEHVDRKVCPACRSYEKKYGVRAYEPHP